MKKDHQFFHLTQLKITTTLLLSISVFLSLSLMSGCLDEIDLPVESSLSDAIVIEGQLIYGNPSIASITITRLFDFTANSLQPVNVREVLLLNEQDQSIALSEKGPGNYAVTIETNQSFKVEPGQSYRLQVTTFDNRKIISRPEPLLATPEPGDIEVILLKKDRLNDDGQIVQDDHLSFTINTPITQSNDGKAARYLWNLEQTFRLTDSPDRVIENGKTCYITQTIDVTGVRLLDGNQYPGSSEVAALLYETPVNYFFSEGYYLTVIQHSLSEGAFTYWDQIRQIIDRDGNMFEAPAGTIRSNFVNFDNQESAPNIFGYFYATQPDTTHFYVAPEDAGSPSMYCPWPANQVPPPGGACPRFPCCECLEENGSQLDKPAFWVQ